MDVLCAAGREQCDLTNIRSQRVDHLQTGLEHLGRNQLLERGAVNRPVFEFFAISRLVRQSPNALKTWPFTLTDRRRIGLLVSILDMRTKPSVGCSEWCHQVCRQELLRHLQVRFSPKVISACSAL